MAYLYKRRRPSIVRNFWVYRRLIALAMVLGLMLWFIWANNEPVTVAFPFRLGSLSSSLGLVILLSALVGAIVAALTMTLVYTVKRRKSLRLRGEDEGSNIPDDRPPADYAAKTTEGFSESKWS
ncbi:lipopolysaccharide assembly protein LapA domain-containing protein [Singulisphaera sp. Ch08]|uniref:Lipopolysaccharide assembly protein LapA domain-containing protein n=1 Tax=Singulisphaera sp. Ch08 TaxID=3120278 RepID=A0AAU7CD05_9BACT